MQLNEPGKALPLTEKSLSLVPDQPAVKKLQDTARKRLER
jgi:hypothetical protein